MEIQYAAEFGWLIAVFVLLSLISDFVKKAKIRRQQAEELARRTKSYSSSESGTVTGVGDTQREGKSLEELLQGLEKVLSAGEEAPAPPRLPAPRPSGGVGATRGPPRTYSPTNPSRSSVPARRTPIGPRGRAPDRALESHEPIEDRDILEVDPQVISLEVGGRSRDIEVADLDLRAEEAIKRRATLVDARSKAHTAADHLTFHERVMQQPLDVARVVAKPKFNQRELRRAFVWREILGPPKGMDA